MTTETIETMPVAQTPKPQEMTLFETELTPKPERDEAISLPAVATKMKPITATPKPTKPLYATPPPL